ncbi:MAG: replication-relaxation family protein [Acidobacteria bacterium]|nr:replication-relaxation family protein [Acidobacteriota bacterium]
MSIRPTKRDHRLLAKLAAARWLTTAQVHRLFFAHASFDAVRKRLRKLATAKFLHVVQHNRMVEALHTLGRRGTVALESQGVETRLERVPPKQLQHLTGINDLRIAVETSGVPVVFFFAAWELPRFKWFGRVIPDAMCAIELEKRLTLALEYDRGSETAAQLWKKIRSYQGTINSFRLDAIVVVADTAKRVEALERILCRRGAEPRRFLGTTLSEFRRGSFALPIFVDLASPENKPKKLSEYMARSLVEVSCRKERFS